MAGGVCVCAGFYYLLCGITDTVPWCGELYWGLLVLVEVPVSVEVTVLVTVLFCVLVTVTVFASVTDGNAFGIGTFLSCL